MYCRRADSGPTLLYSGALRITTATGEFVSTGDVHLEEGAAGPLVAFLAGDDVRAAGADLVGDAPCVEIVDGSNLDPPSRPTLSKGQIESARVRWAIPLGPRTEGDIGLATSFVFHVRANLGRLPLAKIGDSYVNSVAFELPGWRLRMVELQDVADGDFTHIVTAVAQDLQPPDSDAIEDLAWRLHVMLGLLAGQNASIGAVAGTDQASRVRWARWSVGRRIGTSRPSSWCALPFMREAIPAIAEGFSRLDDDAALVKSVDRAASYYMSASGGQEVLDVRIPIACIGLEILGWAVLQRGKWIGRDALNKLSEGGVLRILLRSLGIPTEVPADCTHLTAQLSALGSADWGGPEIIFKVRNQLVHPPKNMDSPEWPSGDLLFEAWQLSTWYLELALLATLGYSGKYQSRLRRGGFVGDLEDVPWATKTSPADE